MESTTQTHSLVPLPEQKTPMHFYLQMISKICKYLTSHFLLTVQKYKYKCLSALQQMWKLFAITDNTVS